MHAFSTWNISLVITTLIIIYALHYYSSPPFLCSKHQQINTLNPFLTQTYIYIYIYIYMEAFDPNNSLPLPFPYSFTNSTPMNSNTASTTTTNNSGSSSSSSCWMDSRIWSRLPQRILDRVIAFLPPPSFFRSRSVCKRWYSLLFSPTFLDLYLHLSPRHRHYFLFFTHHSPNTTLVHYSSIKNNTNIPSSSSSSSSPSLCQAFLFDPYESTWYKLSSLANLILTGSFTPAASSGGLVCYVSNEPGVKTLLLCNPMLGSLTQLPPTARLRLFPSVGMAVTPTSIDVTVAGDDLISPYAVKNLSSESFHVDACGFFSIWGASSAPLPRLCSFESSLVVHVEGKFYTMNYNPFSVLAQDVSSNAWWKIQAPMRRFLRSPSLVESRGRLMLVAAVEKSQLNVPRSLRVWGLQPCGAAWAEVERMPQPLYVQFAEAEAGHGFSCVGHGEFLLILVRGADRALLFDMERKAWQWVPQCPYAAGGGGGGGGGELHGFAFEPRLATPVTALLDHLTQLPF